MWAVIEFNINIEWHKKRNPDDDVWTNARKWENDNVWLSLRIGGAAERRDIGRRGKRQIAWWSTETNSSSTFCRRYRKMNKTFSPPRCTSETAANFYLIFPSNLSFIYFAPKSCIALRIVYQLAISHSVMLGSFTAHCRVELLCGRGRRIAMQCTTLPCYTNSRALSKMPSTIWTLTTRALLWTTARMSSLDWVGGENVFVESCKIKQATISQRGKFVFEVDSNDSLICSSSTLQAWHNNTYRTDIRANLSTGKVNFS